MPTLKWDIKESLAKCCPKAVLVPAPNNIKKRQFKKRKVTYDELTKAYKYMAFIVTKYGDQYLPLFKRLHHELEKQREKNNLLETANKVSREYNPR